MTTYLTYQDISDLTGIPKGTLRQWRVRGKMPEPDYMPTKNRSASPAWKRETIEAWWENPGAWEPAPREPLACIECGEPLADHRIGQCRTG